MVRKSVSGDLWLKYSEECLLESGEVLTGKHEQPSGSTDSGRESKYRQIFTMKIVYLLSAFIIIYVGTEVTIGGEWLHVVCAKRLGSDAS